MKIVYVANINLPTQKAHGLQIMKMCEAFSEHGLEVELLISKRKNNIKDDIFEFYNIKPSFQIKKIFCLDFLKIKIFRKFALFVQYFSFSLFASLYIIFQPKKYSEEDIFYFRDEFSPWFLGIFNRKVFLEAHHYHRRFGYYKLFFSKISGLILITEYARKKFLELGFREERAITEPDAVDLSIFNLNISQREAREKLNLPQDKKLLVYTGKFTTMGMDKGINDIFKALLKLETEDVVFFAVGGSESDISFYNEKAEKMGIENKIKLIGHVPQSDLAIYQKAADILLMPFPDVEHYAYYMSPLKLFEYMASKRPIIATNLPSVREILNNKNSILVQPDNPGELADSIVDVFANNELATQISNQAFSDVQEYTWKKRTERILEFIKNNK